VGRAGTRKADFAERPELAATTSTRSGPAAAIEKADAQAEGLLSGVAAN